MSSSATQPAHVVDVLASLLLSSRLCSSQEEARCIAEAAAADCGLEGDDSSSDSDDDIRAVASEDSSRGDDRAAASLAAALAEYLPDLTVAEAIPLVTAALRMEEEPERDDSDESSNSAGGDDEEEDDDDDDDDGEYIGEGECELCERTIKLTRHHLIPKTTWPRIRKRLVRASDAILAGDEDQIRKALGGGPDVDFPLESLLGKEMTGEVLRGFLSQSCNICRPCHSMVHTRHSEMELAERYNTVEKLLQDEGVVKFCRWASKQKPGKYAL